MKNVLIVAILVVISLGVGFLIGRMSAPASSTSLPTVTNTQDTLQEATENENSASTTAPTTQTEPEATTVNADALTDGQRQLLHTLGVNADEITITPEMVACAEEKLGVARMNEIKNGATPSFLEGVDLVACYNQ